MVLGGERGESGDALASPDDVAAALAADVALVASREWRVTLAELAQVNAHGGGVPTVQRVTLGDDDDGDSDEARLYCVAGDAVLGAAPALATLLDAAKLYRPARQLHVRGQRWRLPARALELHCGALGATGAARAHTLLLLATDSAEALAHADELLERR